MHNDNDIDIKVNSVDRHHRGALHGDTFSCALVAPLALTLGVVWTPSACSHNTKVFSVHLKRCHHDTMVMHYDVPRALRCSCDTKVSP